MTKLEPVVTSPVLNVVGIGFVSQIASAVCEDSGEKALGQSVEIACAILALYVSIPLISAVLDLLENMLRGTG